MQSITPVTATLLNQKGQQPLSKFEIYVDGVWVNLCNLFPEEGLVGWWPFDEGTGRTAYDHSKYGNDGSLENMEEDDWVDGKVGKALDFDEVDDYIDLTGMTDAGTSFSLSLWVYSRDNTAPSKYLFDVETGRMLFSWAIDGTEKIGVFDGVWRVFGDSPSIDTWHHVVFVLNGTTSKMKMYLNGSQYGAELDYTPRSIGGAVAIGSKYDGTSHWFDGIIDEVRIYNRALTLAKRKILHDLEIEGKNYLESISVSLGGASMTSNPVAGSWKAIINNENGIFHPKHPTSDYTDYFRAGRRVRISTGATYGGVDYYWQRLIGFMDKPSFKGIHKISLSGLDYMKRLADYKFRKPDNYWGTSITKATIASQETLGPEEYDLGDAMDIAADDHSIAGTWANTNAAFDAVDDAGGGGGEEHVGSLTLTDVRGYTLNENISTDIFIKCVSANISKG